MRTLRQTVYRSQVDDIAYFSDTGDISAEYLIVAMKMLLVFFVLHSGVVPNKLGSGLRSMNGKFTYVIPGTTYYRV